MLEHHLFKRMTATLLSFVFFTALVGFLTWRITRGKNQSSADGYFLAGRSLTGGYIAGSLLLTNLSTEQLVGLNGAAFNDGIAVMAWEVIAGLSLVFLALFFLPKYLRSGITTVPEFLEKRFDATTRSITTLIFIIAYAGILLPIILYTGAKGLGGILDLGALTGITSEAGQLRLAVWVIGIIGSIYAIFGGLRSVAVSDTLNGFGLLVGGVCITYFGLSAVGEGGIWEGLQTIRQTHPEKFNSLGGADSSVPFSTLFTGVLLLNMFYWSTNQQIIQRTFGARSLKEGQKGVLIAGLFKIMAPLILVLPGIIAFHLYSAQEIAADDAYGTLVRNVLPSSLAGFFAAVMVGAILSSFNSALNSTATLFSLGIYKGMIRGGEADDSQVIQVGKRFGIVIAIVAMVVAPMLLGQDSIFGYLQKMNGLYFIPILSVMVMGLLSKSVPAWSANLALVMGFVLIALGYFVPALAEKVAQMHEFHFLGAVFALLLAIMALSRWIKPMDQPWEHHHSGDVDLTPWQWAKPMGIGLAVAVLLLYMAFADTSVL